MTRCTPLQLALTLGALAIVACNEDSSPTSTSADQNPQLATATTTYVARDLGTLGGVGSEANDVNTKGYVIGTSATKDGKAHAFLWKNGVMADLGTLGGEESRAEAINDADQVVGWSITSRGQQHAFRWSNGKMTDLGTLGGSASAAAGINSSGQIVGWSLMARKPGYPETTRHAFLWKNGKMINLGVLGGYDSRANDINDAGQIAGSSSTRGGRTHAFLFSNGSMKDLGGLDANGYFSSAEAISPSGTVVGYGSSGNQSHAFRYLNGKMTDLGGLGSIDFSMATDARAGRIVGGLDSPYSIRRGFDLYQGHVTLLPLLGGKRNEAAAMNSTGSIVGWSETPSPDDIHATLWIRR